MNNPTNYIITQEIGFENTFFQEDKFWESGGDESSTRCAIAGIVSPC